MLHLFFAVTVTPAVSVKLLMKSKRVSLPHTVEISGDACIQIGVCSNEANDPQLRWGGKYFDIPCGDVHKSKFHVASSQVPRCQRLLLIASRVPSRDRYTCCFWKLEVEAILRSSLVQWVQACR